jgi:hypothetical protein
MKKNLLLVACAALAAQGLQAAKNVEVTTEDPGVTSNNYSVEACEAGNPANCGSKRTISENVVAKVSVKDSKDAKGKTIKIKSYDLVFYRDGVQVATLNGIMPESKILFFDGSAFLESNPKVMVKWEKQYSWQKNMPASTPAMDAERRRYYGLDEQPAVAAPAAPAASEIDAERRRYYGLDEPVAQPTPRYVAPKPAKTPAGYENVNPWFYE